MSPWMQKLAERYSAARERRAAGGPVPPLVQARGAPRAATPSTPEAMRPKFGAGGYIPPGGYIPENRMPRNTGVIGPYGPAGQTPNPAPALQKTIAPAPSWGSEHILKALRG